MRSATSSRNPACQEHRNIIDAFLCPAVPMRFVTAGCKPEWQERRTKSKHTRAADSTTQMRGCSSFFAMFFCEIELLLQPAHFFRPLSQIEAHNRGNRDPTSATPGATLSIKKRRVWRPKVFSPVNSHAFGHFPTTWWWMVGMMAWLTWRCGWHDGGNSDWPLQPSCNSEVF